MPASNDYGVTTPDVVLATTKTYHSVSIQLPNGSIIGRIQDFNATFGSRAITPIYELNRSTMGRPIDNIPGIESGRSISVTRVEVWEEELEVAFGAADNEWSDLAEQTKPFQIMENLFRGAQAYRSWLYSGCWFSEKSLDSMTSEGDMRVQATATINYVVRNAV